MKYAHRVILAVYLLGWAVWAMTLVARTPADCSPFSWPDVLSFIAFIFCTAYAGGFAAREHYR